MRSPHDRHVAAPISWLWLVPLALASGGMLLGLYTDDFHLLNRSAAVFLLAVALGCVRDIVGGS